MSQQTLPKGYWSKAEIISFTKQAEGLILQDDHVSVWIAVSAAMLKIDPFPYLILSLDNELGVCGEKVRAAALALIGLVPPDIKRKIGNDLYRLLRVTMDEDPSYRYSIRSLIEQLAEDVPIPLRLVEPNLLVTDLGDKTLTDLLDCYCPPDISVNERVYEIIPTELEKLRREIVFRSNAITNEIEKLQGILGDLDIPEGMRSELDSPVDCPTSSHAIQGPQRKDFLPLNSKNSRFSYDGKLAGNGDCTENHVDKTIAKKIEREIHQSIIDGVATVQQNTIELASTISEAMDYYYRSPNQDTSTLVLALQTMIVSAFEIGRLSGSVSSTDSAQKLEEQHKGDQSANPFKALQKEAVLLLKLYSTLDIKPVSLGKYTFISKRWLNTKPGFSKIIKMCGTHLGLHPVISVKGDCYWGSSSGTQWVVYDPMKISISCRYDIPDDELYRPCYTATKKAILNYERQGKLHLVGSHTYCGSITEGEAVFKKLQDVVSKNQSPWCDVPIKAERIFAHYGIKFVIQVFELITLYNDWFLLWKLIHDLPVIQISRLCNLQN